MAKWLYTVNLCAEYQAHKDNPVEYPINKLASAALLKFKQLPNHLVKSFCENHTFESDLQQLSETEDADGDDWDDVIAPIYDWADAKRIWIKTF